MHRILRFATCLPMALWVGGIVFFSAFSAPIIFGRLLSLPDGRTLAGDIISGQIAGLHWLGLCCGCVYLAAAFAMRKERAASQRSGFLALAMLLLTAISQFFITPRVHALRDAAEPSRFALYHRLSTGAEGIVLLLGLIVLFLDSAPSLRGEHL